MRCSYEVDRWPLWKRNIFGLGDNPEHVKEEWRKMEESSKQEAELNRLARLVADAHLEADPYTDWDLLQQYQALKASRVKGVIEASIAKNNELYEKLEDTNP